MTAIDARCKSRSAPPPARRQGFTLVELLVVLAVVAGLVLTTTLVARFTTRDAAAVAPAAVARSVAAAQESSKATDGTFLPMDPAGTRAADLDEGVTWCAESSRTPCLATTSSSDLGACVLVAVHGAGSSDWFVRLTQASPSSPVQRVEAATAAQVGVCP